MSADNKKPETISLCDMVDDLVYDKSEINEDQNNVDLSLDDSNKPFASNRHSKPHLEDGTSTQEDGTSSHSVPIHKMLVFFTQAICQVEDHLWMGLEMFEIKFIPHIPYCPRCNGPLL